LIEQDPEQVAVVRKIFELVLEGKTLYGVMQYLNERNIKINRGFPSIPILSRIIHNELYIGIRKRTQSFGKDEGKEDIAIQHIKPIISDDDFIKAGEKIAINNKFVATGKVYFNPFKGIIKCRCGRAMMVKDKKPEKGVSKLTYRCSCNETRNSPLFCSYNIDEISYELTHSVIKGLFLQRSYEITEYFREMSAGKIVELKEIIDGIGKKCSFNRERKEQIDREYSLNEQKLIQLTNPSLIAVLEKERDKIDQKNYDVEKEYADLTQKKRELENRISDIEKANKSADIHERIFNISNEELTELYHLYLEKIEYFPITMMKGFYKVQFKSGHSVFIAITKVRCSPQAFLINGNGNGLSSVDLDTGDIHYNYEEPESISTGINDLNFGWKTVSGTVNIRDFFKEDFNKLPFALEIGLDLSYRQRYKEQLDKVTKQKKQPSQT
jgi:site-specific DNA recombinase